MKTFSIKITGCGTIEELVTAIKSIQWDIQDLKDHPIPNLCKMNKIELKLEFDTLKCEVSEDH
jgi:hypothetical protein